MRNAALAVLTIAGLVVLYIGLRSAISDEPTEDTSLPHVHVRDTHVESEATRAAAETAPVEIERDHPGYAVYTRRGCNVCHGPDLEGTNMGPGLVAARPHWDAESFARYLDNPDSSIRADERLQELDARFSMFVMPSYRLPDDDLETLTALVLGED